MANTKKIFYTVLALGIVALIFVVLDNSTQSRISKDDGLEDLPEQLEPPATPVAVEKVRKRDFVQKVSSNGIFKARIETDIISQVSGQVIRLHAEEGSFVRRDAIILEIDAERYKIAYLKAKDQITRLLREYALEALLVDQSENTTKMDKYLSDLDISNLNDREALALLSSTSRKEWIASATGLTRARLDLRKAELDLQNTVIKAPFDGFVTEVEVSQNSRVAEGHQLMRLVALDPLLLEVGILESELRWVQIGAKASIQLHAFPEAQVAGLVKAISPVVDSQNGTCDIQIQIDNPGQKLKPGMFAQVALETKVIQKRLLIPRDALLIRDDRKLVFIHENELAQWRYVKTGLENDEFIEIEEGLQEGEELIVSGHFNLAHDAKVVVVQR